jgi:hypothetical protein
VKRSVRRLMYPVKSMGANRFRKEVTIGLTSGFR